MPDPKNMLRFADIGGQRNPQRLAKARQAHAALIAGQDLNDPTVQLSRQRSMVSRIHYNHLSALIERDHSSR